MLRGARPARPGRLGSLWLALALLVASATAAMAATTAPRTATTTGADGQPIIRIGSHTTWVAPTGTVTTHLTFADVPAGTTLQPVLYGSIPTRSAFELTEQGRAFPGTGTLLTAKPLPPQATRATITFRVDDGTAPDDHDPPEDEAPAGDVVTLTSPGVHPLVFELHAADRSTLATLVTYVVRLDPADADRASGRQPLRVATVLRVASAPPRVAAEDEDDDGINQPLGIDTATRRGLATLVEAEIDPDDDPPVAFALAPDVLDVLAHGATEDDRALGAAIDATTGDGTVISAPYVPIDADTWAATPKLASRLDALLDHGEAVLTSAVGAPIDVVDLGALGGTNHAPGGAGLDALAAHGTSRVLVDAAALTPLDASSFPRTLANRFELTTTSGTTVSAAQYDDGLRAHLTGDDPRLAANHLMADLAVIALDLPALTRGVVVSTPLDPAPSAASLRAYLDALDAAAVAGATPLITPVDLDTFFTEVPTARDAGDTATSGPPLTRMLPDRTVRPATALADALERTRAKVAALAGMRPESAPAPGDVISTLNRRIDVAQHAHLDPDASQARLAAVSAEVDRVLATVEVPRPQTVTLTSRTAEIPLTIHRAEDGPTTVRLELEADERIEFVDGDEQLITLDGPVTRVAVRVQLDSPGDTAVRARFTSPDGTLLVGETRILVRSMAVSGMGIIITLGSLLFLLAWWIRDIVRTRRRRRAARVRPADLLDIDTDFDADARIDAEIDAPAHDPTDSGREAQADGDADDDADGDGDHGGDQGHPDVDG